MAESNEGSTSQTTSTSNSEGKRKRGPTEMNQIQIKKRKGKMIKVLFNSKGEASGQAGKQLASYTGVVARTFIPITINAWSDVDDQLKEKVWTEITEIHEAQKERQSKCKYHHKSGRKGYVGVAEDLYEKNVVEKGEEIDRALLWKYARKDKNGEIVDKEVALMAEKIDNLMKEKEEGTLTISGSNDVLSMALGTPEHAGRVRGVGGNVKPSAYFKVPRKKRECVSKVMLEQRDSWIMETRKMMEEQQKRHEAAQQALQNQIEMLKVVINTQVPNNTSLQSPNIHPSPILSEKASTNIERKLEEGEKEICGEEGCEDVVEQTESEFMKVMLIFHLL
ncbi:hypothetical protein ACE6H2_006884 [Prunus campanulata]